MFFLFLETKICSPNFIAYAYPFYIFIFNYMMEIFGLRICRLGKSLSSMLCRVYDFPDLLRRDFPGKKMKLF